MDIITVELFFRLQVEDCADHQIFQYTKFVMKSGEPSSSGWTLSWVLFDLIKSIDFFGWGLALKTEVARALVVPWFKFNMTCKKYFMMLVEHILVS